MCISVSRHGMCFGDDWPCATKCEQCEDGKAYVKRVKKVSKVLNTSLKVRIWSFLKTTTCFFASLAAAPFIRSHRSCHGLHGVVAVFWPSVFAFVFVPVSQFFLTHSHHNFLPFWHRDNETASTTTALETSKCTQLFVNRRFNYIPKQDGCLCTNCISKAGWKLGPHPANREHTLQD